MFQDMLNTYLLKHSRRKVHHIWHIINHQNEDDDVDIYKFGFLHSKFDLLDISNIDLILNPNVDLIHYKIYIFHLI